MSNVLYEHGIYFVSLSRVSEYLSCIILGLEIGILVPPVNQVATLALPCIVYIAALVAQLVEIQPRMLKFVGSSPTRGSNFSFKGCCLEI